MKINILKNELAQYALIITIAIIFGLLGAFVWTPLFIGVLVIAFIF